MRRRRGNESRKHGKQKSSGSVRPCFRETAIVVVIVVQHFLPPSPVRRGMTQKFCALPPSGVTVSTIRPGQARPGQANQRDSHSIELTSKSRATSKARMGQNHQSPLIPSFLPFFLPSVLSRPKGVRFIFC